MIAVNSIVNTQNPQQSTNYFPCGSCAFNRTYKLFNLNALCDAYHFSVIVAVAIAIVAAAAAVHSSLISMLSRTEKTLTSVYVPLHGVHSCSTTVARIPIL